MKAITILAVIFSFALLSVELVAEQDNFSSMPDLDTGSNQEPALDSRPENLRVTNNWDGSTSTNWFTPANWSLNRVPLSTDEVNIHLVSSNRYPLLSGNDGVCYYLNVDDGASLTFPSYGKLNVTTGVNIQGELTMDNYTSLAMGGSLLFRATAVANFSSISSIWVGTNVTFMNGSSVNIPNTELLLIKINNSFIQTNAPTVIGPLIVQKPGAGYTYIHDTSTASLSIYSLDVQGSNKIYHTYPGTTIVRENLLFSEASTVRFSAGTLSLEGATNGSITDNNPANNYLNNLQINKTGGASVTMATNLYVKGTVAIQSGSLNAQSHTLEVGGEWTNSVGASGFIPGTGTVTFNQIGGTQQVYGTNNFYNVLDSHSGDFLEVLGYTQISELLTVNAKVNFFGGGSINTVSNTPVSAVLGFSYNFTYSISSYIGGGSIWAYNTAHVNIADLTQNGLYGDFYADNGHLEIHQDTSHWIDLHGDMTITNNGIVDIYGGSGVCWLAYEGNSTFTMSSGSFNLKDQGFYLVDQGNIGDFIVSGGTISVNGTWTDAWGIFDPTGGSVVMTGTGDNNISPHASSWFWNLVVNKVASREGSEPQFSYDREGNQTRITRSSNLGIYAVTVKGEFYIQNANIVSLHGNMYSSNNGTFNIDNASLHLNGNNLTSTGDLNINANGVLQVDAGSNLRMSNGRNITVNNGGSLLVTGDSSTAATVTRNGTGYYGLNVESGGTIGAWYGIFEYINADGVNLKPGSLVHPSYRLNFSTFRNGASGARLLTINNSQSFTINGAIFPTNSGGSNVSKTVNSGSVYFSNWSGAFSGPGYENDPFNRINWEGYGVPPITDLTISYISATNRVQLTWTYPLPVINYKIYRSLDPEGTFAPYATSPSNTWSEVVPGPKYFYHVTAVTP